MQGKARILVYGFSPEEQRRVADGLASIGIPPALQAGPGQLGAPVRRILAGEAGPRTVPPVEGPPAAGRRDDAQERLVLFHHLSDAGVQRLMRFFREALAGRPLFAVTTPTSMDWSLGELLAHLLEERAALEQGG